MATQEYWADDEFHRDSTHFARRFPTLDSLIASDDPVRLIDEILDEVDWPLRFRRPTSGKRYGVGAKGVRAIAESHLHCGLH